MPAGDKGMDTMVEAWDMDTRQGAQVGEQMQVVQVEVQAQQVVLTSALGIAKS
jgi:hypothetical protein